MAKINRKYIDKHWLVFVLRGILAVIFGCLMMFFSKNDLENLIAIMSLLLLIMGIIDAVGALYCSTKKHGWFNSVIDALVDVVAAVLLLFLAKGNIITALLIISIYTIVSGVIDIFHGIVSTVDPTDRFIRFLAGVCGCVIGLFILNSGELETTTFIRFFGAYMLIVGITSLIYGVHNRTQKKEDTFARSKAAIKKVARKTSKRKSK